MSVGEMSVGEMSVGEVSVGEMSVGEMSGYPSDHRVVLEPFIQRYISLRLWFEGTGGTKELIMTCKLFGK